MNAELTKRTLVVSERPTAVELRQGFFFLQPRLLGEGNLSGPQSRGSWRVSTGGSISVSANVRSTRKSN